MGKDTVAPHYSRLIKQTTKNLHPALMAPRCDNRIEQKKYHTNNFALCTPSKKGEESFTLKNTFNLFIFSFLNLSAYIALFMISLMCQNIEVRIILKRANSFLQVQTSAMCIVFQLFVERYQ